MQRRERGYAQASDDTLGYGHNDAEANGIPSSVPDAQPLDHTEIDREVRSLVCGDLRIMLAFPMTIRGREASGAEFREQSVVDRLGSRGVCTHLHRQVAPGARLFVLVQLSVNPSTRSSAPWIAAHAVVDSAVQQPDGTWHTALAFTRHRFIYAS